MGICDIYKSRNHCLTFFTTMVHIKIKILLHDLFQNFHNYESNS